MIVEAQSVLAIHSRSHTREVDREREMGGEGGRHFTCLVSWKCDESRTDENIDAVNVLIMRQRKVENAG